MANYVIADPFIGAPAPASVTATSQYWPLGLECRAVDISSGASQLGGAVFRYCQGSDVGTAGLVVYIQSNQAIKLGATQNYPVGIAAGALSATNVYGWVQVQGLCDYMRGTNVSIGAASALYIGTAAGFVQSGSAAASRIYGMLPSASYTSSQSLSMSVELNRPYVGVTASN